MRRIENFAPSLDLPHYMPCLFAAFHERVRYEGQPVFLSLFSHLSLQGLPCLLHELRSGKPEPHTDFWQPARLLDREVSDFLGFESSSAEAESFEAGMAVLRRNIDSGKPMLVFGSMYYLPYTKSYLSPSYLEQRLNFFYGASNHWLIVYGYSDDEVLVYDPIPNQYQGPLSMDLFEKFWKSDKGIPELAGKLQDEELYWSFGYGDIAIREQLTEQQVRALACSALKTTAAEFVAGRVLDLPDEQAVLFFGRRAYEQVQTELQAALEEERDKSSLDLYSACVFNIRFGRNFVRMFLQDLAERYGDPFTGLAEAYVRIVTRWEKAGNMFQMNMTRKTESVQFLQAILRLMEQAVEMETEFFEEVLSLLDDVPLLSKGVLINE